MKENEIKLILSLPVSVNKAYINTKKGRSKSASYINWKEKAYIEMLSQKKYKIIGNKWLFVKYDFYFPIYNKDGSIKKKDVFNYEKVLSDFLEKSIEGFDDKKIKIGQVQKIDSKRNEVQVNIKEIINE